MGRQLFGTDGIRGVAGEYPLDPATVYAFGRALGEWAKAHSDSARVLIGMDTRESGPELAMRVMAGLRAAGASYEMANVLPTPGVAWLTREGPYAAGLMISASHNPYQDNGLKVFAHSGYKVPDAEELELEKRIFALRDGIPTGGFSEAGGSSGASPYLQFLKSTVAGSIAGKKIVVDCGNGAASHHVAHLLRLLGVSATVIHCSPTGRNINEVCGALHTEAMQAAVIASNADMGVAFDGDADRAIFADRFGKRIDGDHVLLICGLDAKRRGALPSDTVVATIMSNLGLELGLKRHGVKLVRTAVGDKYVLEEMIRLGASIGGEQSGHVIFHEHSTTGDGMLTMLQVLDTMARSKAELHELAADLNVLPQILVNVRFGKKRPLEELESVQSAIRSCQEEFGEDGRVVVRFSGTEPLARVMVEGPENGRVEFHAHAIADAIQRELRAVS